MFWAEPNGYTFVCSHVTSKLRHVGGLAKKGVEQMREVEKDERMTESVDPLDHGLRGTRIGVPLLLAVEPSPGGLGGGPWGLRRPVVGQ